MLQEEHYGFVTTMGSCRGLKGAVLWWWLWFITTWSSSIQAYNSHNTVNGIIQNPVVSCQDVKKKILCLPLEYSKFDLPYRNDHNLIDIGKCITVSAEEPSAPHKDNQKQYFRTHPTSKGGLRPLRSTWKYAIGQQSSQGN